MATNETTDASGHGTAPDHNDQNEDELTLALFELAITTLGEWRAKKGFEAGSLGANADVAVPLISAAMRNMVTTIISTMELQEEPKTTDYLLAQDEIENLPELDVKSNLPDGGPALSPGNKENAKDDISYANEEHTVDSVVGRQDEPSNLPSSSSSTTKAKKVKHKGNTSAKNRRKQAQVKERAKGE